MILSALRFSGFELFGLVLGVGTFAVLLLVAVS
jgi:hypothetical protein